MQSGIQFKNERKIPFGSNFDIGINYIIYEWGTYPKGRGLTISLVVVESDVNLG
jgi:hypothetical protein